METFTDWINALDSFVWGPAMLVLILGTGLYLQVRLGGMPVRIADTAGIRDTADPVESEGVHRARQELATADLALLVVDLTVELAPQLALLDELPDPKRALVVYNKLDMQVHTKMSKVKLNLYLVSLVN